MKIVFATGIYPPEIGGPAGYVKGVATELANQGHEVSVVTYGDEKTETGVNYKVYVARRSSHVLRRYFEYFLQAYKQAKNADLIYAQGPVSEGFPASLASILSRKPLILKVVGDYAWEQYQQTGTNYESARITNGFKDDPAKYELLDEFVTHRHKGKVWLMEAVERWVASKAKQIIVPSKYLKTIVEKWGIETNRIQVIPNSVANLPKVETRDELRKLHEIGDKKMLFTAGRAISLKRVDFLLEMLSELPSNFVLVVAGDGPMLTEWQRRADLLKIQDRVAWLGSLDKTELARFYKMADLFLLASSHETAPHVLLEATNSGLKCIASNKGGIPEIASEYSDSIKLLKYDDKFVWVDAIRSFDFSYNHTSVHHSPARTVEQVAKQTLKVLEAETQAGFKTQQSHKNPKKLKIISIGSERKLFQPGKVRDRIVDQLKDFDTTIIVFAKQKFDEQITPNVRVISTNSWNKFFYVTDALRIVWQLRKQKFNVITSQDPTETGLVAYLASKLLKTALAIQDHGYHFHGNYYRKESWLNQFRYLFARFVVTRAHTVRVVSQRTEDALTKLGISKDKIVRFPVTITPPLIPPLNLRGGWHPSLDLREGKGESYFLLVCRFVTIKRIDLAIHAFSIVAKQDADVKLKIVGQGSLESQIHKWIEDFDLQDKVEIIPWTENLADLYQNAIATLITSDREGFGMTALESLACDTPVIMTNVGCAHEVVKSGENGIIVPVGDVIALANAMEQLNQIPITPLRPTDFEGRAKYQLPMQEASGINSTTEHEASGQSSESGFPPSPKLRWARVIRNSMFASEASMTDFLQSAIRHQLSAKKKEDEDFWRFSEKNTSESQQQLRLLFITQVVDKNDPILGFVIRWIQEFVDQKAKVTIFTRKMVQGDLPQGANGQDLGQPVIRRVLNLWYYSIVYRNEYDQVLVHMTPQLAVLGWPIWFILGKKVYMWHIHPKKSFWLKSALFLAEKAFTAVDVGIPFETPKKAVVGHGIDLEKFKMINQPRNPELLIVGRVHEIKQIDKIIDVVRVYNEKYSNDEWILKIIGSSEGHEDYLDKLYNQINETKLDAKVQFLPAVAHDQLPGVYQKCAAILHATEAGSMDKVVLEAMACGTPIFAVGKNYLALKGVSLLSNDIGCIDKIHAIVTSPQTDPQARQEIFEKHNLSKLINRMIKAMIS